jgi:hypothetical protein
VLQGLLSSVIASGASPQPGPMFSCASPAIALGRFPHQTPPPARRALGHRLLGGPAPGVSRAPRFPGVPVQASPPRSSSWRQLSGPTPWWFAVDARHGCPVMLVSPRARHPARPRLPFAPGLACAISPVSSSCAFALPGVRALAHEANPKGWPSPPGFQFTPGAGPGGPAGARPGLTAGRGFASGFTVKREAKARSLPERSRNRSQGLDERSRAGRGDRAR